MTAAARSRSFEELYAEIQALPEGSQGEILTPGEVHVAMGRPGAAHRQAFQAILRDLLDENEGMRKGGGWWLENEPEVRFGARLFVPDVAGWRVERVPARPDAHPIDTVPDWSCEILSPTTARTDQLIKLPVFAEQGVQHIWIVNPIARMVQVFAIREGKPLLVASASDETDIQLPPFDLDVHPVQWWLPDG